MKVKGRNEEKYDFKGRERECLDSPVKRILKKRKSRRKRRS